jgi:hypothetical protein
MTDRATSEPVCGDHARLFANFAAYLDFGRFDRDRVAWASIAREHGR